MRKHLLQGIVVGVFLITVCACLYSVLRPGRLASQAGDPEIQDAQKRLRLDEITLARARVQQKQGRLDFYDRVLRGSIVAGLCVSLGVVLVLVWACAVKLVRQASVYIATIGESTIPVHYTDLQRLYPVLIGLTSAEIQASLSDKHDKAFQMTRQILASMGLLTRTLVGSRGVVALPSVGQESVSLATNVNYGVPSFSSLITHDLLNSDLILGFVNGQPVRGSWHDLKTCAIAGKQGSGKTNTLRFLLVQGLLQGVETWILDPHKNHKEGLVRSLGEVSQFVHVVNPFDVQMFFDGLNQRINRRLQGEEESHPCLLVIEELASLSHSSAMPDVLQVLQRFTEETRKVQMFGLFSSQKWNSRRFQQSAEIRQCLNSSYIHKTKMSQADLLLEDRENARRVQRLQRPGQAVFVSDYGDPQVVDIPLVTEYDLQALVERLQPQAGTNQTQTGTTRHKPGTNQTQTGTKTGTLAGTKDVLCLSEGVQTDTMTVDWILTQMTRKHLKKAELARQAGVSVSLVKKILNKERTLTKETQQKFFEILAVQ